LAYADDWGGTSYGYDIEVTAGSSVSFSNGYSRSLSLFYNIWTATDWIWQCRTNTSSNVWHANSITATGTGTFNAPDGVIYPPIYLKPNSRSFSSAVTF
jgi:hypothetical protein